MDISLFGKTAVVCGSTQGIGWAIAEELAHLGANCILVARNEEMLKDKMNLLETSNVQHHGYKVADFTDINQVRSAIKGILDHTDVDILVNNTGGPKAGPIIEAEEKAFADAIQQHLLCNHALVKAVIPGMRRKGFGRIINIISTSVRIPINNLGVSNTTRAAVAAWAKTMSNELGQFNITVNNILPGYTDTQRLTSLITTIAQRQGIPESQVEQQMKQSIPMRRFGNSSEIAAVAAFLASPAASYVNGVSIPVDGGSTGTI